MTKHNSKANLGANYLKLEMLQKAIYPASPDLDQVTKFNPKCKILNVFWTLPKVKGKIFSIGHQISKFCFLK